MSTFSNVSQLHSTVSIPASIFPLMPCCLPALPPVQMESSFHQSSQFISSHTLIARLYSVLQCNIFLGLISQQHGPYLPLTFPSRLCLSYPSVSSGFCLLILMAELCVPAITLLCETSEPIICQFHDCRPVIIWTASTSV